MQFPGESYCWSIALHQQTLMFSLLFGTDRDGAGLQFRIHYTLNTLVFPTTLFTIICSQDLL
jgi:hypothetical protein